MILYQSDIEQQRPYIDYQTKNESFLRMAMVLKRMGIKNNTFHLALYQKELIGVDPFDYKNLDNTMIARILYESKINPFYWFREVCRIPSAGDAPVRFIANRFNIAFIWSFFNDIDIGVVVARQSGKTITTQALVCYMMYVLADNLRIGLVSKDQNLNIDNVLRLKDIRDALPSYFIERTVQDIDRKEGLSYSKKHNYYMTYTAATDERSAYKTARGSSMALVHFDEIAFINYNWIIVPTVVNTMLKASEQARAAGLPSSVIYTTTAGNPDTKMGAYALNILDSAMPFNEKLYDLQDRNALMELIDSNSKNRMLYIEYSYRQLGRTDEWFKEAAARSKASQDDINRDLLNIWQASSEGTVIPEHLLRQLREGKMDPSFVDFDSGFLIKWYMDREIVETERFINKPLVMGMDTSENIQRDYTAFCIIDPSDLSVVATCRCNENNTMGVARHVLNLLLKYPKLVWIPERQSSAIGIIDFVIQELQEKNINPFFRIYNEVVQNYGDPKYKNMNIYNFHEIYGQIRGTFGYRTGGGNGPHSRNLLYKTVMIKYLEMAARKVRDRDTIIEFSNLTVRNDRVDHSRIGHDDAAISLLLGSYMIFFGKNLQMYGIPQGTILQNITLSNGTTVTSEERQEQIEIRRRISDLEEMIARNPTHILKQTYMRELNILKDQLDESMTIIQPIAVSQMEHDKREVRGVDPTKLYDNLLTFHNRWIRT